MAKIYGEFGIELYDLSLMEQFIKMFKSDKNVTFKQTKRNTYLINLQTEIFETYELEEVSDRLYELLVPYFNNLLILKKIEKDRLYSDICFVIYESDEKGLSIILNQKILKIAADLDIKIQFDGI